jgi:hypothetical protein
MLKSVLLSIVSALRSVAGVIGRIAMAPLRCIDRVLVRGDGGSPREIPEVRRYDDAEPLDAADRQAMYIELANRIMAWAADSIVDDAPAPLPEKLPIGVREWLPGMTRDECRALINAHEKAVSAHIQRLFALPGLRPVQPLTPLREWPAEPSLAFDEGSPSFVSYAAGYGRVA